MDDPLVVQAATVATREAYEALAERSYGHPVEDIRLLQEHADIRVALRGGRVVGGGLGLLLPQYFGGAPVLSACLGAGCVAPEERGGRLAARVVAERVAALRDQGAVVSSIWTASTGYARQLGWQTIGTTFAWSIRSDEMKRSVRGEDVLIEHGSTPAARAMQRELAKKWNGPIGRPDWWWDWKAAKANLTTYGFRGSAGEACRGLLSIAMERRQPHGMVLVVHDFWAADASVAASMLAFLGRHGSRAEEVTFRRAALPSDPNVLHLLHRYKPVARAWHPWSFRVLDYEAAVRLRGWAPTTEVDITLGVSDTYGETARYQFSVACGQAILNTTERRPQVTFNDRQFAAWYAGAYRTSRQAIDAGVSVSDVRALQPLLGTTTELDSWLPDLF